ncbi:hypothetical protein GQ600_10632 [Phytophthora cactorum]|nr:hypothetical protein GQ600_10631 [Phytophthora cactorum]KAF1778400.1 hypothetical protein GQ600_10632 [Phytophthora cactorum]
MGGLHSSYEAKPKPHKNAHRQQQAVRHDGNRIDTKPDQLQRVIPMAACHSLREINLDNNQGLASSDAATWKGHRTLGCTYTALCRSRLAKCNEERILNTSALTSHLTP